MKIPIYTIIALSFLLIRCQSSESGKESSEKKEPKTEQPITVDTLISEHFKESNIEDTLLSNSLSITVTKSPLEQYITREYDYDSTYSIEKYFDASFKIEIKRNGTNLFDTVLIKENFKDILNQEFYKISVLYNVWFHESKDGKNMFFGTIGEPETDNSYDFIMAVDIDSNKTELIEVTDSL